MFIIVMTINWLLERNYKIKFRAIKYNREFLYLVGFYLINLIGLFYSNDYQNGISVLVKRITLIIFPIVFATSICNKKIINVVGFTFILTIFVSIVYSLFKVYQLKTDQGFTGIYAEYYHNNFYRDILASPLQIHPTYYTIYILFAVFLVVYFIINNRLTKNLFVLVISIAVTIIFLVFALFLSSRMPLLAFMLVALTLLIRFLINQRLYFVLIVFIGSFVYGTYSIYSNPIFTQRFIEIKATEWKPPVGIHHNSTNIRIGVLTCSYELLKTYWILGTGTGDMQKELNACYKDNGFSDVLYKANYNTHSTYIDALLMLGIPGFVTLILLFGNSIYLAVKFKEILYLAFLILFVFCCISESILNSQKGIVFFAFFNTLFAFYSLSKESSSYNLQN